jgi:capsular polysaccharide transport system permease protein
VAYIGFVKTEKYESSTIVMVKDLSKQQTTTPFGAMLLAGGSGATQDSMLLNLYIRSSDMFGLLNKEFNLSAYYSGELIDIYSRLYKDTPISIREINSKNIMTQYQKDLTLQFDEPSSTLLIKFAHADAKVAQKIVQRIVQYATKMLNEMEQKSSKIVLKFLKELEREKYDLFLLSQKNLLDYQNRHHSISPTVEVEQKSGILAKLEGELIQKEVEYKGKLQYLNKNAPEMKLLKGNLSHIKASIKKIRKEMTGESKNRGRLNKELADFELLKSELEFNKEVYRQTLTKLEESSIMVSQNAKNLVVITEAKVADSYSYPNKFKDILTTIILLSLLYGIAGLVSSIIRDHKD